MAYVCKNCETVFEGKFCNHCGQKRYSDTDKKFSHILEEAVHFVTHLEGTLPRTIKTVLFQPGKLSQDYCFGIRKKYYKPISFFLLLIVAYLLFPMFEGLNMQLPYYKGNWITGSLFTEQIEQKMAALGITEAELSELFRQKSEKVSKILLFLLIPLTAFSLKLLYWRNRRPMFDHFIFATEANSFYILFIFLIIPLLVNPVLYFLNPGELADNMLFPILTSILMLYFYRALKRFYDEKWHVTIAKSILFMILFQFSIQVIYKTVLFEVTIALI